MIYIKNEQKLHTNVIFFIDLFASNLKKCDGATREKIIFALCNNAIKVFQF